MNLKFTDCKYGVFAKFNARQTFLINGNWASVSEPHTSVSNAKFCTGDL